MREVAHCCIASSSFWFIPNIITALLIYQRFFDIMIRKEKAGKREDRESEIRRGWVSQPIRRGNLAYPRIKPSRFV